MVEIGARRLFTDKNPKKCIGTEDTKPVVVKFDYTFARPHLGKYYFGEELIHFWETFYGKIAVALTTTVCTFTGIEPGCLVRHSYSCSSVVLLCLVEKLECANKWYFAVAQTKEKYLIAP